MRRRISLDQRAVSFRASPPGLKMLLLAGSVLVLAACGSGTGAPETTTGPATTVAAPTTAPTTTTAATTTTTAPATTTTTTEPPGPETEADFAQLYRELEAIRREAAFAGDLELALQAVTEDSESYQLIADRVEAAQELTEPEETTYTIDEVVLYDRPAGDRVLLVVTDTFDGTLITLDEEGNEVDRYERQVPVQQSLVTLVETEEGWRILAYQLVADLELEPAPDDSLTLELRDEGTPQYQVKWWRNDNGSPCLQLEFIDPPFGRFGRCFPQDFPVEALFFPVPGGPLYTTYFLITPGGEMASLSFDLDDGSTVEAKTLGNFPGSDATVAVGLLEGSPVQIRLFDAASNLIFDQPIG